MPQIEQSLVCVWGAWRCTEVKWFAEILLQFNDGTRKRVIPVSFFPLSRYRPRCMQKASLAYTGWKDCRSRINVLFFSLTKDISVYDILQQLGKKSHLQQSNIQIDALSLLHEPFMLKMQQLFYFCHFLRLLQTSSGQWAPSQLSVKPLNGCI